MTTQPEDNSPASGIRGCYFPVFSGHRPLLSAVARQRTARRSSARRPPLKTIQGEGKKSSERGGNSAVYEEVSAGKKQVMAWAYERPDKGRGFGFTGLHKHENLANDSMRALLLNAAALIPRAPIAGARACRLAEGRAPTAAAAPTNP